jgi:beta-glucosidase-like glycosyl hydrolase
VNAGNDILLIAAGHYASEKDVAMILKTLLDAVASGRIKKARIRRSYERIIAAKKKLAAVETY